MESSFESQLSLSYFKGGKQADTTGKNGFKLNLADNSVKTPRNLKPPPTPKSGVSKPRFSML